MTIERDAFEAGEVGVAIVTPAHGANDANAGFEGDIVNAMVDVTAGRRKNDGQRAGEFSDDALGKFDLHADVFFHEAIQTAMFVAVQADGVAGLMDFFDHLRSEAARLIEFGSRNEK